MRVQARSCYKACVSSLADILSELSARPRISGYIDDSRSSVSNATSVGFLKAVLHLFAHSRYVMNEARQDSLDTSTDLEMTRLEGVLYLKTSECLASYSLLTSLFEYSRHISCVFFFGGGKGWLCEPLFRYRYESIQKVSVRTTAEHEPC